jgi:hypothetical protein
MSGRASSGNRPLLGAALAFVLLLFGYFCLRASLPNARVRPGVDYLRFEADGQGYYLPRGTNSYDNAVTLVTARNFARDGFLHTHFLPNRGGAQISFSDRTGTQCETIQTPANVVVYQSPFGNAVRNLSINNDCVYIHFPPLADWVFGAMAMLGLGHVLCYKILAIGLSCLTVLFAYLWLRGQVRESAALVALLLTGTLPAIVRWADALFFHSFQYFFLAALTLSWSRFLATGKRRLFALTWFLYFCEAMVSHQLTICAGVVIVGLLLLDGGSPPHRTASRMRLALIQAAAPVVAFVLHAGMSVSLLGRARTWSNLTSTVSARMVEGSLQGGVTGGMKLLAEWIADDLVPWTVASASVVVVVLAGRAMHLPLKRPLALLAIFFLGGISFWTAFPGTTSEHFWMMYRQIMPFVVVLIAMVVETLFASVDACRRRMATAAATSKGAVDPPNRAARFRALGWRAPACLLSSAAIVAWVAHHNLQYVIGDIRWNAIRNRVVEVDNLVRTHLDAIHWREDSSSTVLGLYTMPVSGLRVGEPPRWLTDFRMQGPGVSHYEVWWLEEQRFGMLRLLVDQNQVQTVRDHCLLAVFDGKDFRQLPESVRITTQAFVPTANERAPEVPYSWIRYSLPSQQQGRALRLTCGRMGSVTLRQIEAYPS